VLVTCRWYATLSLSLSARVPLRVSHRARAHTHTGRSAMFIRALMEGIMPYLVEGERTMNTVAGFGMKKAKYTHTAMRICGEEVTVHPLARARRARSHLTQCNTTGSSTNRS
jgi:hypothetical protein